MSKQHSEQKGEGTGPFKGKLWGTKPGKMAPPGNSAPGKHKRGTQG